MNERDILVGLPVDWDEVLNQQIIGDGVRLKLEDENQELQNFHKDILATLTLDPDSISILDTLQTLPLDACSIERNPVTGEVGWRAPLGYVFRMSGRFYREYEWNSNQCPEPSLDIYLEEHGKEFDEIVEEVKGDKVKAREVFASRLMQDSEGSTYVLEAGENEEGENEDVWEAEKVNPEEFFDGKWLVIHPNIDGSDSNVDYYHVDTDEISLSVKDGMRQHIVDTTMAHVLIPARDHEHMPLRYNFSVFGYEFSQLYAEGKPGEFSIQLVEKEEEGLTIAPPMPKSKILLPDRIGEPGKGLTSHDYGEVQIAKGKPWNLDVRVDVMRYYRNAGIALSDDLYTTELIIKTIPYIPVFHPLASLESLGEQLTLVAKAYAREESRWRKHHLREKSEAERYGEVVVFYPSEEKATHIDLIDDSLIEATAKFIQQEIVVIE